MELSSIQTGDNFLTTDYNSFVSTTIVKVMKKYAKQHNIKSEIVLSHAAELIWIAGELYIYGSIDSGYKPWLFRKHYSLTGSTEGCVIMRRKTPLTEEEQNKITNYCQYLVGVSFMYQYFNLIKWLALVYLHINLFKLSYKISKLLNTINKITYCYQSTYMSRKNLNPEYYNNHEDYMVDFFMLIDDNNYEIIYKNLKPNKA